MEVFTHLKALYEEQWGDAEATAPPEVPGMVESMKEEGKNRFDQTVAKEIEESETIKA